MRSLFYISLLCQARLQAPRPEIPGTTNTPLPALTATQTMRNLVQREGVRNTQLQKFASTPRKHFKLVQFLI